MERGPKLLALRCGDQSHALEPGRAYLLGSADACDLRVTGAATHHARVTVTDDGASIEDLGADDGVVVNEERVTTAALAAGDRVAIAGEVLIVQIDDGTAAFVPLPAMRAAATQRRVRKVRAAAAALRHQERTFSEAVAEGMRDAPWLALSLLVHALLILLIAIYAPIRASSGTSVATIHLDVSSSAPMGEGPPAPPEVAVEAAADDFIEDPDPLAQEEFPVVAEGPTPEPAQPAENPTLTTKKRPPRRGTTGAMIDDGGLGSGGFRKQVEELQETGLEIVFVFDSTGSMTRTIQETKATIVEMCDVLRALVPDARVGLVTYRDHGSGEDYLVRSVPLELDHWRASNFVQFVRAGGGGDRPEAVRAGLVTAMGQTWRPTARRVIVLAGDAPTHPGEIRELLQDVRRFTEDRRSFVHTLITSPDRAGEDTHRQFRRIARNGRGVCEPISNQRQIMQRVLTLAFGKEFDRDIEEVMSHVTTLRDRVDTTSLHLVRRAGPELAAALRQQPMPRPLWNALVRKPRRPVAVVLLELLADKRTAVGTRHAVAAALQQILELEAPPIDPQSSAPASRRRLKALRELAERLPE